jgi:signal transduction histidine kinase
MAVAITDTGQGIAQDRLSYLFDGFALGDESRNRHTGGAGLGLPITRRLCEMMGGSLGLESKPGNGTSANVTLPLSLRPAIIPFRAG